MRKKCFSDFISRPSAFTYHMQLPIQPEKNLVLVRSALAGKPRNYFYFLMDAAGKPCIRQIVSKIQVFWLDVQRPWYSA